MFSVIGPRCAILVGWLACASPIDAQEVKRAEFEVASFKPSPPAQGPTIVINGLGTFRGGRLTFSNASLNDLLKYAYRISSDAQLAGPEWISSKAVRFDIEALAPPQTSREQLAVMMQALLADRMKLAVHHELRELRYLALTIAKDGPKMRAAEEEPTGNSAFNVAGRIVRKRISMPQLALLIARFERQPVIDMTGLDGFYEVKLEWAPSDLSAQAPVDAPVGPSIYSAVQSQLGLKLEPRRGPVDVLVIDSVRQTPVAN